MIRGWLCGLCLFPLVALADVGECVHLRYGIPSNSDQIMCRLGYAIGYNYENKSADWVAYQLKQETTPGVERQDDFRVDPDIPSLYQTTPSDYDEPVYVQGHLANSESIDQSIEANSETFFMSNMVPQLPGHNGAIWKGLENRERKWADSRGEVFVYIGVLYEGEVSHIGNQVPVPTAFWKVIYAPTQNEVIAYLIPHEKLFTSELDNYLKSVNEIEERVGVDLLVMLDNPLENDLEDEPQPEQWP